MLGSVTVSQQLRFAITTGSQTWSISRWSYRRARENRCWICPLADGTYELRVALGESGPFTAKQFEHKNFPWLGNKLGTSREVYPPYQPILVEGREARVVLRSYRMNDLGLWDSVVSEGRELLAAPVTLHVSTDEGEERWQSTAGQWVSVEPDRAVYKAEAKTGAVQVHTVSTIEYDGCMRVEMELL